MLVGSSAHAGAGFGSSGGGNSSGVCACATTVLLVCTLVLVALSDHEPEIRSDYDNINRTCPMPSIFRSSSAVAGAFSTKRSVGNWEATVELGTRDADGDFQSSGYKFVVPCSYRVDRLGHDYELLDEHDEVVASVIAETFSWGWSLQVYDCGANLLASIEQKSLTRAGLELEIKDSGGRLAATTDYELHPIDGDKMNVRGVGAQQGTVLSTVTHKNFNLGGKQWDIVMNAVGAAGAAPGGDERVIAAVAAYMTWKDMDKGKGSFSGVCVYFVVALELASLPALAGIALCVFTLSKACVARCEEWRQTAVVDRSGTSVKNPMRMSRMSRTSSFELFTTVGELSTQQQLQQTDGVSSSPSPARNPRVLPLAPPARPPAAPTADTSTSWVGVAHDV